MPRYVVERTFPEGLRIPASEDGIGTCRTVVDRKTIYCIYDGPDPEAIRVAAEHNGLPVDRITKVSVLDSFFYR